MRELFERLQKQEANENTALILMLSILGEKLTEIALLIEETNKLSTEILSCLNAPKIALKKEDRRFVELTREDYMD